MSDCTDAIRVSCSSRAWTRLVAFLAAAMIATDALAQTWSLTTAASATGPPPTATQMTTSEYTLPPGPVKLLDTSIRTSTDHADSTGRTRLRRRSLNVVQSAQGSPFGGSSAYATITTDVEGIGTVVWPGTTTGTPVPGTITLRLNASGSLVSNCHNCNFDGDKHLSASLSATPFSRVGGGLPPTLSMPTVSASPFVFPCSNNTGAFVLDLILGPGLEVGDRYSYSFSFNDAAGAGCEGDFASATSDDTLESLPGVLPEIGFDLLDDDCGGGTVSSTGGVPVDVLTVNSSAGDGAHILTIAVGDPITLAVGTAPSGPARARYGLWVWRGRSPNPMNLVAIGSTLGCTINPTPAAPSESPQPLGCLRGGLPFAICGGAHDVISALRAPWIRTHVHGLSHPGNLMIQGIIADNGAANSLHLSVTNAVILEVQ